jgi:hypothetical protein
MNKSIRFLAGASLASAVAMTLAADGLAVAQEGAPKLKATDWYHWRGPQQNGQSLETGLPTSFSIEVSSGIRSGGMEASNVCSTESMRFKWLIESQASTVSGVEAAERDSGGTPNTSAATAITRAVRSDGELVMGRLLERGWR